MLISKIGSGFFSEENGVWLARDKNLDKIVALKILDTDNGKVSKDLEEAIIGNRLDHRNLLKVYSADIESIEGKDYLLIAQEYHKNGSIIDRLNNLSFLPINDVLKYLIDVLVGLERLHDNHIIHNDIKPSNILIGERNQGILADYGISSIANKREIVEAKNCYILNSAPETDSTNNINILTDIYQVGMTGFRLLNGIGLYNYLINMIGFDAYIKNKSIGKIPNPKDYLGFIPFQMKKIINKATNIDSIKRYGSALTMRRDLEKCYFAGYWTCDESNNLIGIGTNYKYFFNEKLVQKGVFEFEAYQRNERSSITTRILKFCLRGALKDIRKIKKKFFLEIVNNAK